MPLVKLLELAQLAAEGRSGVGAEDERDRPLPAKSASRTRPLPPSRGSSKSNAGSPCSSAGVISPRRRRRHHVAEAQPSRPASAASRRRRAHGAAAARAGSSRPSRRGRAGAAGGSRGRRGRAPRASGRGTPEEGKAWWLWCRTRRARSDSHQTLRDSSLTRKRREPTKWQTELTDHVMWWRRKIRIRPPQNSACSAAPGVPPQSQPAANGSASERDPQPEPARDEDHAAVGEQVLAYFVHSARPTLRKSQPTCACQTRDLPAHARAEAGVRRVRVALPIGEVVVLAVVRDPPDHRPLDRHRAEHGEAVADRPVGLVGAVGEETVEADRDAEARQHVADGEDGQVAPGVRVPQRKKIEARNPRNGIVTPSRLITF